MREPGFDERVAAPRRFWSVVGRMLGALWRPEMRRWRWRMAAALVLTIAAKGLSVLAPVLLGEGINRATAAGAAGVSDGVMTDATMTDATMTGATMTGATAIAGPFMAFVVAFALARFLANGLPQARDALFQRVTQDANRLVAVDAFAHAQAQSLQFHVTRRAGALSRIIERGAMSMEYLLRFLAFNIGPTLIELALAAIVMAAFYSVPIALAAVVTVGAYAVITIIMTEWRNKLRRSLNEADTELRAISADTLTNFETVKAFAAEARESGRYDDAFKAFAQRYVRSMQSMYALNAAQEFVMAAGLFAAVAIGVVAVAQGRMQAGDVTAIILMLSNIYRPLNILGFAWREIKQGAVDIEKLYDLMDLKPEVEDAPDAADLVADSASIAFEDVVFSHEGRDQGLDKVSFEIPAGGFVGLVGPSGAGKSTVLKLLFRFYDPKSGAVKINGRNVRDITQSSLRCAFGLVPQEVVLFNDTLRFNLAYARPEASEAEIMEAARRAQLADFIKDLPQGLETRVGERGLKLSGGEKQRVGVARAILRDPAVLVLDEATSSLDSETEREVQEALADAAKGRTTIAVAHRLSTIAHADMILVMDAGRIVERGTHADLIAKDGLYASLWRRQAGEEGASDADAEAVSQIGAPVSSRQGIPV
ncbi:MAG: ABC transporter ATP-binding protein/permease [Pseudomonadota bacterium]